MNALHIVEIIVRIAMLAVLIRLMAVLKDRKGGDT